MINYTELLETQRFTELDDLTFNYFEFVRETCEGYSSSVIISFFILLSLNLLFVGLYFYKPELVVNEVLNIVLANALIVFIIIIQLVV